MALNYAEVWSPDLLEIMEQESLTSPFVTTAVKWLSAKTFHFTQMSTSGYKSHSRLGGWNKGTFAQTDVPFILTHDRDISFLIFQHLTLLLIFHIRFLLYMKTML